MYGPDGQNNVPHREWLIIFDRVLLEVKEEMKQHGRADDFFGARV
jgi:adenosine deaminase CECR1